MKVNKFWTVFLHLNQIREEALACRKNVALFDMSYLGKFYLCGRDAQKAANYLFTANTNRECNKTIYTCMLNYSGGVEADCIVTVLKPGSSGIVNPIFKGKAFYIGTSLPRNAINETLLSLMISNFWFHIVTVSLKWYIGVSYMVAYEQSNRGKLL